MRCSGPSGFERLFYNMQTALIMAAGSGTRMKSAKPKVAFDILGKPLVRWVVDASLEAGCDEVVCILGHGCDVVEPLVEGTKVVYQRERLGTGHAVMCAGEQIAACDGSVVVLSGDCPLVRPSTIKSLLDTQKSGGASAVILTSIENDPTGYGRIVRDEAGSVSAIVEHKDCSPEQLAIKEVNSGMYAFDSSDLAEYLKKIGNDNAQGEYYLTDVIALMVQDGKTVEAIAVDDPAETMGINNRVQLAAATKQMQRRINERHMLAGVTMIDPDLVWIGPDVQIAQDVEILPLTTLMGKTQIGTGCVLGPNTRITDSRIGQDCRVDESVVLESVFDEGVNCGPRAYIRPGVHMCAGSKAGTHVEIKKSTIGAGSKVPHLSYIGDTTMGEGVNIGAGSITCNYDGKVKSKTCIGDRTFVGSDTMMVAPVAIGNDCLVGAGSTITKDVPDGALAVARGKQKNLEGFHDRQMRGRGEGDGK